MNVLRKPNFGLSVRLKLGCIVIEDGERLEISHLGSAAQLFSHIKKAGFRMTRLNVDCVLLPLILNVLIMQITCTIRSRLW